MTSPRHDEARTLEARTLEASTLEATKARRARAMRSSLAARLARAEGLAVGATVLTAAAPAVDLRNDEHLAVDLTLSEAQTPSDTSLDLAGYERDLAEWLPVARLVDEVPPAWQAERADGERWAVELATQRALQGWAVPNRWRRTSDSSAAGIHIDEASGRAVMEVFPVAMDRYGRD
jgi:hypothetical protein